MSVCALEKGKERNQKLGAISENGSRPFNSRVPWDVTTCSIRLSEATQQSMLSVPIDYVEHWVMKQGSKGYAETIAPGSEVTERITHVGDGIAPHVLFSSPCMRLIYYNFPSRPQV
ncbi:hypothetical protein TNIN_443861 [Trichonephila inaurata madagascariensis]|uniref:Uncharacterized protein n=1 Tax=Trichonephila inaurata madagascariensis TaxID=2747483 RepID=A0A8X6I4L8_9ARAC|nr:hypothetical protein TNIN_443861 [Trichonephila inaurata madagascariensis]